MARRQPFGNVSKLPSGRYRARYRDPTVEAPLRGPWVNAPHTFSAKATAEAWLSTVRSDIERGIWKHPDTIRAEEEARERLEAHSAALTAVTVADWGTKWMTEQEATMAAGTVRKRRSNLNVHILPHLGGIRLIDLTSTKIASWYSALPSDGVRTACYQTLRAMLNEAVSSEDTALESNPCRVRGGGRARAPRGERYLLRPAQVDALAEAIRSDLRVLVLLLADAGLRINEALALRHSDVTIGDGAAFVDVAHSVVREGKRLALGPTKTGKERRVQVTPATARALRIHLEGHGEVGADALVFPSPESPSTPLRDSVTSKALRSAMASAGVVIPEGRYGGWHAFRHYSATRFGQAGASTAAIMRRYGWSKPEQAMHYQRADSDYEREMLDRMARISAPDAETWGGLAEAAKAAEAGIVNLNTKRGRTA